MLRRGFHAPGEIPSLSGKGRYRLSCKGGEFQRSKIRGGALGTLGRHQTKVSAVVLDPIESDSVSKATSVHGSRNGSIPETTIDSEVGTTVRRSESIKQKISESLKRKWQDPAFRCKMVTKLKGRTPWNKGKKMELETKAKIVASAKGRTPWNKGKKLSVETRARMRASKLGSSHSKETRRKMSTAQQGRTARPETMRRLSEKLKGVPKTPEHRARIAASQRKRQAAIRALRAVENVHKIEGEMTAAGAKRARYVLCASSVGSGGMKPRRNQTRAEVLNTYKGQLREYRSVQEELAPWMSAFLERHGRKPTLVDVEATQIVWLIDKFKDYVVLREKLMNDIPFLRPKLRNARKDFDAPLDFFEEQRINGVVQESKAVGMDAAKRLSAAMEYRKKKMPGAGGGPNLRVGNGDSEGQSSGEGAGGSCGEPEASKQLTALPPTAPERVRKAMTAAMEYRRIKAKATKAVASAAAVEARAHIGKNCSKEEMKKNPGSYKIPDQVLEAQEQARLAIEAVEDAKKEVQKVYTVASTKSE